MRRYSPLLTDLYELTMAYGYWKAGMHGRRAVFHHMFRNLPFKGGFCIACGLGEFMEYLARLAFEADEIAYLSELRGNDDRPLFEEAFLAELAAMEWSLDVDAIPEGTVVFPQEPLVRIEGPLLQCQLVETTLLNLLNFQTLVATKAARVCLAAKGDPVMDFGLRRAQGPNGGLCASRAAFVGGCMSTSNVLAGKEFGIRVAGTHAHSWVMAFASEEEAFAQYADALPNNAVFLVETYNTLDGVRKAIEQGHRLRSRGFELGGVRLDSGDLAYLSVETRKMLDAAGFPRATIVASNDLDEYTIASLKEQGAAVGVWGVGTRLVTAYDQPALDGIYKLAAIQDSAGKWQPRIKLSEQAAKISTPGILQVRRFSQDGQFIGDMIHDLEHAVGAAEQTLVDPLDSTRQKSFPKEATTEELLVPAFRGGKLVYESPSLVAIQERTADQLGRLHEGHKRFLNPHEYPVGLAPSLHAVRTRLIAEARGVRTGVEAGAKVSPP